MKVNRCGITRIVFEFKSFVVKIPNFSYSWDHFLKGLIANMSEGQTWKYSLIRDGFNKDWVSDYFGNYNSYSDLLCPVKWSSWGGWILIMAKADVATHENSEYVRKHRNGEYTNPPYITWVNNGYDGDCKPDNFGHYKNRLVKIDYA